MGIDVYMRWDGMSSEEQDAQYTGFVPAGERGYLREAYHGEPYATKFLLRECWGDHPWGLGAEYHRDERVVPWRGGPEGRDEEWLDFFVFPPDVLLERLPEAAEWAKARDRELYNGDSGSDKQVRDFVGLYIAKYEAGLNPRVGVSF